MRYFEDHKSVKETAILFIGANEAYEATERKEKAKSIYEALQKDRRLSIDTRNSLMQQIKKIYKNA